MKTSLIVCILALALSVYADDDIAAIYAAIPSAKDITRTSDGYRVRDGAGKIIFVTKTTSGYHVAGEKNTTFITKTTTGYRISNGGNTTFINKSVTGYRTSGSNTTFTTKTSTGYRVSNGGATTDITETKTGYRVNTGR